MKSNFLKTALYLITLITIISCNPEIIDPPATERKIVQSNLVHEDNINGRIINPSINLDTNIINNYRFIYNSNGTINSVSVFDDSDNNAVLTKEIKFVYYSDKVRWFTFNLNDPSSQINVYDAFFNSKKQVTRIADSARNGFNFTYVNDKLTTIEDTTPGTTFLRLKNFVYEANNLKQYDIFQPDGSPLARAVIEYGVKTAVADFDLQLYSQVVKFLYVADINIISKAGLNFGVGSDNIMIKKTEFLLPSLLTYATYSFDYEYDRKHTNEIIKRSIAKSGIGVSNPDTAFYQYKY